MEQPCYKCGASVEEGTPFCKHCGAPQIRVLVTATDASSLPQTSENMGTASVQPLRLPVIPSPRVEWARALPAAVLGGICSVLAMRIPYAIFGPAFLLGGAIAVLFYCRRSERQPTPMAGAQIGAVSGGLVWLFFSIIMVGTLVYWPDMLRKQMLDSMAQMVGHGYDAQRAQQIEDLLKTHTGLTAFVVFGVVLLFVVFVAGSSIGGAFCAAWLAKRSR